MQCSRLVSTARKQYCGHAAGTFQFCNKRDVPHQEPTKEKDNRIRTCACSADLTRAGQYFCSVCRQSQGHAQLPLRTSGPKSLCNYIIVNARQDTARPVVGVWELGCCETRCHRAQQKGQAPKVASERPHEVATSRQSSQAAHRFYATVASLRLDSTSMLGQTKLNAESTHSNLDSNRAISYANNPLPFGVHICLLTVSDSLTGVTQHPEH